MNNKQNTPEEKFGFLSRFSLNRPVTVLMTLLALLVVGYIAYNQIAVELMPAGFTPPFLGIWTPYPNANPEEVEQFIAQPIEEMIRTIKGVQRVSTRSSSNGCWTWIEFAQNTDMDVAYAQLRDRMERAKLEMPDDVDRYYLRKWTDDDDPILWIAMSYEGELDDPYLLVENLMKKPLERIDGVANVEIWGADEKSIQIEVNQDAVKGYKINFYDVIQKLRNDNFAISSGHVRSGGHKIFVRSVGKFRSLDEIRNIPIKGTNIFLKDIARVEYDVPEENWTQRHDGKPAIQLGIYKESMANTVALCKSVEDKFDNEFKKDPRLSMMHIEILFNQGDFINESIDNLKNAAFWGGIFAFLVIYFFLRRFRMSVLLNLAIPLSIMVSMTVLYFIGWTMNLITMVGLMISIGMVVDNSIVVLENIYRKRSEGMNKWDAAGVGASEVALAITMATFTSIVVFLPLILMNSNAGFKFYMLRIGLPVIFSLLASLVVAMIFIPLAAYKIVSRKEVHEPVVINKLNNGYQRVLRWSLNHRLETFLVLVLIFYSMMFAMNNVASTENMDGNINDFRLIMELPDNYTLEDAGRIVKLVEDTIKTKADEYQVKTIDSGYRATFARIRVFLIPEETKAWYQAIYEGTANLLGIDLNLPMPRDSVIADVKRRIPELPGVEIRTSWRQQGGDESSIAVSLYGDDTGKLAELSEEVERRLRNIPEIISVETDREKGEDEIQVLIDREQAKKYGINPRTISGTVMYALRGIQLPKFQTEDKEITMTIQLKEEDRETLQQLKNITFFSANGKEIPLAAVAKFSVKKGFGEIVREDGKTYLSIQAFTTEKDLGKMYGKVDKAMAGFEMPYGYKWTKGERFHRMEQSNESQGFAIILSITFVFLLMGILFESFVLPLSVIIAIPFSFVGAYWMMYITNTPIDLMSQIGFIILIGIVVNNSIVLIDLVNRLRKQGYARFDALMQAGYNRFRPILMTAFTTIGGLIPMAVGNAKMIGMSYAPMGRTIIGGLIFSTFVSLVAVPWAYTIFDDMRNYFKRIVSGVLLGRKKLADVHTEVAAGK
ncbi:MAG: efflux RND transporter permease subunit [Calditrichaceae bacterium]